MIKIKPIIGIVGRLYSGESNIVCIEEVRTSITKMGGIPLLILPIDKINVNIKKNTIGSFYSKEEIEDLKRVLKLCDGFILPGGDTWYQLDEIVVEYAIKEDKPLLAICLGMQALSKILSGEKRIAYDNTIKNQSFINHYVPLEDFVHAVTIDKNSKLFSIIGEEKINVNSRHNYHIKEIDKYFISSRSEDGLIESVELNDKRFIIGVQWHPESILDKDINSKKLFESFFANFDSSQKFH